MALSSSCPLCCPQAWGGAVPLCHLWCPQEGTPPAPCSATTPEMSPALGDIATSPRNVPRDVIVPYMALGTSLRPAESSSAFIIILILTSGRGDTAVPTPCPHLMSPTPSDVPNSPPAVPSSEDTALHGDTPVPRRHPPRCPGAVPPPGCPPVSPGVPALTACSRSVSSRRRLRHLAAASLFLSRRTRRFSSSSGVSCDTDGNCHHPLSPCATRSVPKTPLSASPDLTRAPRVRVRVVMSPRVVSPRCHHLGMSLNPVTHGVPKVPPRGVSFSLLALTMSPDPPTSPKCHPRGVPSISFLS